MDGAGKSGTCALCGEAGFICQSHIIPKFVGDWLRRHSATGYFVNAEHASKRKQDILKIRLLCERCEELFSKHENYFKRKVFDPLEKLKPPDKPQSFPYGDSLELFATSLSWRVLKADYGRIRSARPDLIPLIDEAEYCWREFLLGRRQAASPYESHLLFIDSEASDANSLGGSDWYRLAGVHTELYARKCRVLAYAKLPHMLVVTSIYPYSMRGWSGTSIKTSGNMTTAQSIDDDAFREFFAESARSAMTRSPGPSPEQSQERLEKALRDPSRFLRSQTSEIMMREMDENRRKRMEGMPESIRCLVERVILGGVADPYAPDERAKTALWAGRQVASRLADLSDSEARRLDETMRSTVSASIDTRKYARFVWKADYVWIVFMVHHNATKEHQHSKIRSELANLLSQQRGAKTPFGIFSMNCESDGCSFESGFGVLGATADRRPAGS